MITVGIILALLVGTAVGITIVKLSPAMKYYQLKQKEEKEYEQQAYESKDILHQEIDKITATPKPDPTMLNENAIQVGIEKDL